MKRTSDTEKWQLREKQIERERQNNEARKRRIARKHAKRDELIDDACKRTREAGRMCHRMCCDVGEATIAGRDHKYIKMMMSNLDRRCHRRIEVWGKEANEIIKDRVFT